MANTIDMQDMRYLNLFSKITRINTRYCFKYNEMIIFAVPRNVVSRAIGISGKNVKKIIEILGRKVKIVASPNSIADAENFLRAIVDPVGFKSLEINQNQIILNAGAQNKAALIGRNKRRLLELQKVSKDFFKKELKII